MSGTASPGSSGEGAPPAPSLGGHVFDRLSLTVRAHFEYLLIVALVLFSVLIWFNFSAPPYGSNTVVNLFWLRQLNYSASLFNTFYWPGSYVPQAFGTPVGATYGAIYAASGQNLAIPLFAVLATVNVAGAICLFELVSRWLARYSIPRYYALIAVVSICFNAYYVTNGYGTWAGYYAEGPFTPGNPSFLLILAFLTYLALFRNWRYSLLVGLVSFFAFALWPIATVISVLEYVGVLLLLLVYRWDSLRGRATLNRLKDLGRSVSVLLAAIVAANAYLIYPVLLRGSTYLTAASTSTPSYPFNFSTDAPTPLGNAVRLISNWFLYTPDAPSWAGPYLNNALTVGLTCLLPALAFVSIPFLRRRADWVLYGSMVVVSFLAATANPPFGAGFVWLTSNVFFFRPVYNAYDYSPVLLVYYSVLSSLTVGRIALWLSARRSPSAVVNASSATGARDARRTRSVRLRRASPLLFTFVCAGLLVGSAYPALSPAFSQGSPGYPMSVSLPGYYAAASDYLQSTAPNEPVMVFPQPDNFLAIGSNGSVWYTGPNTYPYLIENPSISYNEPPDYYGTAPSEITAQGFVYYLGNGSCPSEQCGATGSNAIPQLGDLLAGSTGSFVSTNSSLINWTATTPGDTLTFGGSAPNQFMVLSLGAGVSGTIHRLDGVLPSPQNLTPYAFALLELSLENLNVTRLRFALSYDSNRTLSELPLSNYAFIHLTGSTYAALLPLSTEGSAGELSEITRISFEYTGATSGNGSSALRLDSLRFTNTTAPIPSEGWVAESEGDTGGLVSNGTTTWANFTVSRSTAPPYGNHYFGGTYVPSEDLSDAQYAIVNYSVGGISPSALAFGYKSISSGGVVYDFSDFPTYSLGNGEFQTIVNLALPTSFHETNSLSSVEQVYLVYTAPGTQPGSGFLNVSAIDLVPGSAPGAGVLAHDLARLGVAFAYVDTDIENPEIPGRTGAYYNAAFGNSAWFQLAFHEGSVTIYRNLAYAGEFFGAAEVRTTPLSTTYVGAYSFEYAGVYDNATNANVTYVAGLPSTANLGPANVTDFREISPTEYEIRVTAAQWSVLGFRTNYNAAWRATASNGTVLEGPYVVDGFANGWLAPPGNYTVTVTLEGQATYGVLETVAYFSPVVLLGLFLALTPVGRTWLARLRGQWRARRRT